MTFGCYAMVARLHLFAVPIKLHSNGARLHLFALPPWLVSIVARLHLFAMPFMIIRSFSDAHLMRPDCIFFAVPPNTSPWKKVAHKVWIASSRAHGQLRHGATVLESLLEIYTGLADGCNLFWLLSISLLSNSWCALVCVCVRVCLCRCGFAWKDRVFGWLSYG